MRTKKHIQKLLVDIRNRVIMDLYWDDGLGPTEIGAVINQSKQLVNHVILKNHLNYKKLSRKAKNNHA